MNRDHERMIDRLESSAESLLNYLAKLPDEAFHHAPAPGEWSLHQVAAHVRDVEQQVFLYRLKRMLEEEDPAVENFDQDAWTKAHYSVSEPIERIIAEIRAARKKQISLLKRTKDKDWTRTAQHPTWKKISIEWLLTHAVNHAMEHAAQAGDAYEIAMLKKLNG